MYKANYWLTVAYNGLVIGIWPAAGLAFLLTSILGMGQGLFLPLLLGLLAVFALCIGWIYHTRIWRRRRSRSSPKP
jgi:hypothetical protein